MTIGKTQQTRCDLIPSQNKRKILLSRFDAIWYPWLSDWKPQFKKSNQVFFCYGHKTLLLYCSSAFSTAYKILFTYPGCSLLFHKVISKPWFHRVYGIKTTLFFDCVIRAIVQLLQFLCFQAFFGEFQKIFFYLCGPFLYSITVQSPSNEHWYLENNQERR